MKSLFLLLHSDYLAEIRRSEVKDGVARIEDKEFIVDYAKPFLVKTRWGALPLYVLKWDTLTPLEPKGFKIYESPITPEMHKRGVELKFWHFLLKRFRAELPTFNIMWFMMALLVGMVTMFVLIKFRILPV